MNPKAHENDGQLASILVVDDTPANLQVLAGMLKDRGYKVRPVPSGRLALAAARRDPPDLILLDINMPEMNGYEVCEHLKADHELKGIPVIFISALTEPLDKVKAFAIGGVDYLTKPFQMEELHARVETHLKLRRQQIELEEYSLYLESARERLKLDMKLAHGMHRSALETSKGKLDAARGELTILKIANADAIELGEAERTKREESERMGRMKDEFLSNLSHEIRTPLNAIIGWSQLLVPGETSKEEMIHGLEVITRNARAQARLIDDLLDMSRVVSGKLRLDVKPLDLPAIIDAAIETVNPAAVAKRMTLQKVIDPIACPVTGDPDRLHQVVWNLLINAIKFTPSGGSIQVALKRVNSCAELSVSDNGKGIHADFLPYVFDRFRQADTSLEKGYSGLGLGLAIVKSLVELHGGSVRVTSDGEGKGTTFTISLPISVVVTTNAIEDARSTLTLAK
jgi:signal transduction histidine kinase